MIKRKYQKRLITLAATLLLLLIQLPLTGADSHKSIIKNLLITSIDGGKKEDIIFPSSRYNLVAFKYNIELSRKFNKQKSKNCIHYNSLIKNKKSLIKRLDSKEKIKILTLGTSLTGGRWRWVDIMHEWLNAAGRNFTARCCSPFRRRGETFRFVDSRLV